MENLLKGSLWVKKKTQIPKKKYFEILETGLKSLKSLEKYVEREIQGPWRVLWKTLRKGTLKGLEKPEKALNIGVRVLLPGRFVAELNAAYKEGSEGGGRRARPSWSPFCWTFPLAPQAYRAPHKRVTMHKRRRSERRQDLYKPYGLNDFFD